jgi:hypothetical protein
MRVDRANPALAAHLMLAVCAFASLPWAARAGGPLLVGGATGLEGVPITWDPAVPVQYRVDGGPFAARSDGTAAVDNAAGLARVQAMFKVWQDVPTASITFSYAGPIQSSGVFTDGNVDTVEEYNAVVADCNAGAQSPFIFDADGSIFFQLTGEPALIGFSGPCLLDPATSHILSGMGMFSGRFRDGINDPYAYPANYELTAAEMDEVFAHEFGHFIGLDHSQLNSEVLTQPYPNCLVNDLAGLPLMFPYEVCQAKSSVGLPMLAPDDLAWVSKLYPETVNAPPDRIPFSTVYGTIRGTILFSDGQTHAQGLNVIARDTVQPRRIAVSVFSGYLFTVYPGQSVTGGDNSGSPFGSLDPLLVGEYDMLVPAGNYHVWVESFSPLLEGATFSTLYPPIPNPGSDEYWDLAESATDSLTAKTPITISAGAERRDVNIILNGTPPRFDSFESARQLNEPLPAWRREEDLIPCEVGA